MVWHRIIGGNMLRRIDLWVVQYSKNGMISNIFFDKNAAIERYNDLIRSGFKDAVLDSERCSDIGIDENNMLWQLKVNN